ncbi:MAG: hypothetical protein ACLRWQ_22785 [Flavonifractor plautii]
MIIGDGLRGNDDVEVPVEGAEYIETRQDRQGHHGCRCVHQPDPLQGP